MLILTPDLAGALHIRPVLFGGVRGFFKGGIVTREETP